MLTVEEARERSKLINQINNLHHQAIQLVVQGSQTKDPVLFDQAEAVEEQAKQLEADYYTRFPNCLSQVLSPWGNCK